jgi:hypothetical protein
VVGVWSGADITAHPSVPLFQLSFLGAAFALPPNDLSGARLALRDLDGDGNADLVVTSAGVQGRYARVFTLSQLQSGGGSGYMLPLGAVNAPNGIYVG